MVKLLIKMNLFYLKEGVRNRIEKTEGGFRVVDTEWKFTDAEIRKELAEHPERFSPNVILRALYQERLLPNVAFIGGGGELAYWLELRDLFTHYKVPYPVLVLRNSFLLVGRKWVDKIVRLGLSVTDFFAPARREGHLLFDLPGYIGMRLGDAGAAMNVSVPLATVRIKFRYSARVDPTDIVDGVRASAARSTPECPASCASISRAPNTEVITPSSGSPRTSSPLCRVCAKRVTSPPRRPSRRAARPRRSPRSRAPRRGS